MKNWFVKTLLGVVLCFCVCPFSGYAQEQTVPVEVVSSDSEGENWERFYRQVFENYHRKDRGEVLRLLNDNAGFSLYDIFKAHMPDSGVSKWTYIWGVAEELQEGAAFQCPLMEAPDAGIVYPSYYPKPIVHDSEEAVAEEEKKRGRTYTPALKTNLLYDAVTAVNLSLELPIGKRFSIMFEDVCPWWTMGVNGNVYCFQIWEMGVEPRWWFKSKGNLRGHFFGLYARSGLYDVQYDKSVCYQGEYWSAGLSYGYAWKLGKKLQMEFSLSLGYLSMDYRSYQPDPQYEFLYKYQDGNLSYFGPTKLALSLVWPITFGKKN